MVNRCCGRGGGRRRRRRRLLPRGNRRGQEEQQERGGGGEDEEQQQQKKLLSAVAEESEEFTESETEPDTTPPPRRMHHRLPAKIQREVLEDIQGRTKLRPTEIQALYKRFRKIAPDGCLPFSRFCDTLGVLGMLGETFLAERLFKAFDTNRDNELSFSEFAVALGVMMRGSDDEKLDLSFKIFNPSYGGIATCLADYGLSSFDTEEEAAASTEDLLPLPATAGSLPTSTPTAAAATAATGPPGGAATAAASPTAAAATGLAGATAATAAGAAAAGGGGNMSLLSWRTGAAAGSAVCRGLGGSSSFPSFASCSSFAAGSLPQSSSAGGALSSPVAASGAGAAESPVRPSSTPRAWAAAAAARSSRTAATGSSPTAAEGLPAAPGGPAAAASGRAAAPGVEAAADMAAAAGMAAAAVPGGAAASERSRTSGTGGALLFSSYTCSSASSSATLGGTTARGSPAITATSRYGGTGRGMSLRRYEKVKTQVLRDSIGYGDFVHLLVCVDATRRALVGGSPAVFDEAEVRRVFSQYSTLLPDGTRRMLLLDFKRAVRTSTAFLSLLGVLPQQLAADTSAGHQCWQTKASLLASSRRGFYWPEGGGAILVDSQATPVQQQQVQPQQPPQLSLLQHVPLQQQRQAAQQQRQQQLQLQQQQELLEKVEAELLLVRKELESLAAITASLVNSAKSGMKSPSGESLLCAQQLLQQHDRWSPKGEDRAAGEKGRAEQQPSCTLWATGGGGGAEGDELSKRRQGSRQFSRQLSSAVLACRTPQWSMNCNHVIESGSGGGGEGSVGSNGAAEPVSPDRGGVAVACGAAAAGGRDGGRRSDEAGGAMWSVQRQLQQQQRELQHELQQQQSLGRELQQQLEQHHRRSLQADEKTQRQREIGKEEMTQLPLEKPFFSRTLDEIEEEEEKKWQQALLQQRKEEEKAEDWGQLREVQQRQRPEEEKERQQREERQQQWLLRKALRLLQGEGRRASREAVETEGGEACSRLRNLEIRINHLLHLLNEQERCPVLAATAATAATPGLTSAADTAARLSGEAATTAAATTAKDTAAAALALQSSLLRSRVRRSSSGERSSVHSERRGNADDGLSSSPAKKITILVASAPRSSPSPDPSFAAAAAASAPLLHAGVAAAAVKEAGTRDFLFDASSAALHPRNDSWDTGVDVQETRGLSLSRLLSMHRSSDVPVHRMYMNRPNFHRTLARGRRRTRRVLLPMRSLRKVEDSAFQLSGGTKGVAVHFGHENWNTVINIMVGIRLAAGRASSEPQRAVERYDFVMKEKFSILPKTGMLESSHHKMCAVRFIDYAPMVFRRIREQFHISSDTYVRSVGPEQLLGNLLLGNLSSLSELVSEGRSGALFYYTADGKFMIKTVTKDSAQFMRSILRSYYEHAMRHPHTLLTRFYGLHAIRLKEKSRGVLSHPQVRLQNTYFIVMGNVFHTPVEIHRRYDLKGSTYKRQLPAEQLLDSTVALKDLDLDRQHEKIMLGPERRAQFLRQLRSDVHFLRRHRILDYSLLLGIYYTDRDPEFALHKELPVDSAFRWNSQSESESSVPVSLTARDGCLPPGAGPGGGGGGKIPFFQKECGGMWSADRTKIYYVGIIDMLTYWGAFKRLEHITKTILTRDPTGISCVNPTFYAERFMRFMENHIT